MKITKCNGAVIVNGKTYTGNNISMINDKVYIDGKNITELDEAKEILIQISGNVDSIDVGYCKSLTVLGNVNALSSQSGDVYCDDVTGNITTQSGDVECRDVGGFVSTMSGDVTANGIKGDCKTMSGDIKKRN